MSRAARDRARTRGRPRTWGDAVEAKLLHIFSVQVRWELWIKIIALPSQPRLWRYAKRHLSSPVRNTVNGTKPPSVEGVCVWRGSNFRKLGKQKNHVQAELE